MLQIPLQFWIKISTLYLIFVRSILLSRDIILSILVIFVSNSLLSSVKKKLMEAIFITWMTLQDILLIIVVWGEIFLNILLRWNYFSYSSAIRFEFGFLVLIVIITCVGLWTSTIFVLREKKQGFEKCEGW